MTARSEKVRIARDALYRGMACAACTTAKERRQLAELREGMNDVAGLLNWKEDERLHRVYDKTVRELARRHLTCGHHYPVAISLREVGSGYVHLEVRAVDEQLRFRYVYLDPDAQNRFYGPLDFELLGARDRFAEAVRDVAGVV